MTPAHGKPPARPASTTEELHTETLVRHTAHVHHAAQQSYTVRAGDTLTSIAQRFYGDPMKWHRIYHANTFDISNPDLIYVGQRLTIPGASSWSSSSSSSPESESASDAPASAPRQSTQSSSSSPVSQGGTLSCQGLEQLWQAAGGSPSAAFMAAEIARAESGGDQYARSGAGDVGYWQINEPIWGGSLATNDPIGNARAAIQISGDGTNWNPWVTYQTGAYQGQC